MSDQSSNINSRIADNIASLTEMIAEASADSEHGAQSVKLVAVSKTVGAEEIAQAIVSGHNDFAENRTNLFKERQSAFPEANWHFIGRIQTNKVKDFTGSAALVHSVASDRALLAIDRRADALDCIQPVLIEVNISGEESKDGITVAELPPLLETAATLANIRVDGLMTIAPIAEPDVVRSCFAELRRLREQLLISFAGVANLTLRELSMGMSDDFLIAVREGATIVRIGRSVWK